ncbi:MAG: hypothetical protein RIE73_01080 [Coleofasciculus sp. C1-SOL-03]|uniref:hypothetical protein n=1 Tax=Coleofasciculus sp. C1-SOL-03 TaxID=3069522 RepID=UPI003304EF7B
MLITLNRFKRFTLIISACLIATGCNSQIPNSEQLTPDPIQEPTEETSENVSFADPNLEAAIRRAIDVPQPQPLTRQQLVQITDFGAIDENISRLDGIENLTNLKRLILQENQIKDVTPLAGLNNLEWLYLRDNQIKDITPLAALTM